MSQFIQNIIKGKKAGGSTQSSGEFDVQVEIKKIQDHLGFLEKKIDQLLAGGGQNRRPSHHRGGGGFDRPRGDRGFRGNRHGGGFRGNRGGGDDRGNRAERGDDHGNTRQPSGGGTWRGAGNDGFRPRKQHFNNPPAAPQQ